MRRFRPRMPPRTCPGCPVTVFPAAMTKSSPLLFPSQSKNAFGKGRVLRNGIDHRFHYKLELEGAIGILRDIIVFRVPVLYPFRHFQVGLAGFHPDGVNVPAL